MNKIKKIESFPGEKWKELPGYEDYYEVSNMGRVKSLAKTWIAGKGAIRTKPETIMKKGHDASGYYNFTAHANKIRKPYLVHDLVYDLFGNEKRNGRFIVVCHKNGIKNDNRINNLYLNTIRNVVCISMKEIGKSSKYSGVTWHKQRKKWQSSIQVNGKNEYLGYFNNELKASNTYQKRLKEILKNK